MISKSIVFITTTLHTKWLGYQSKIIKNFFPDSLHIVIDGRTNWPNSWFWWINEVKKTNCDYYIHIDEDFFITNPDEIWKVIEKMENDNVNIMGCPDGYHQYRGANPIAINSFLLFGRVDDLRKVDFNGIMFSYTNIGWVNNMGLSFKESYKKDYNYRFDINGGSDFNFEQEPYYAFMWKMKEMGLKFDYLYPHFDNKFKSTNPRIEEDSKDIGIHMWYVRDWFRNNIVHGMSNIERYSLLEKEIENI
jgi:hypothetical protein